MTTQSNRQNIEKKKNFNEKLQEFNTMHACCCAAIHNKLY